MQYAHIKIDTNQLVDPVNAADKLLNEFISTDQLTIFLDHTWEGTLPNIKAVARLDRINSLLNCIQMQLPGARIFLLLNSWWRHFNHCVDLLPVTDVLYVDYFLYRTYREVVEFKQCAAAYRWPRNQEKFLFLTGVAGKIHRIRLLSKIINQKLIDRCQWSLRVPKDDSITRAGIHKCLPEMTVAELDDFLNRYQRSPDNIYANTDGHRHGGYGGLPYDVTLYTKTSFSLVSESKFDNTVYPWITEKTWKPILNHHPFIIAGDTNTLCQLHRKGFVTFEKFLPMPDYDTIVDPEVRLDAIVTNVGYWTEHIADHADEINRCVLHNKKLLDELYLFNLNGIKSFIDRHQLDVTVDDLVPTSRHHLRLYDDITSEEQIRNDEHFRAFYNSIKDDNWPGCNTEAEFVNLPESIQKECEDVFGYVKLYK